MELKEKIEKRVAILNQAIAAVSRRCQDLRPKTIATEGVAPAGLPSLELTQWREWINTLPNSVDGWIEHAAEFDANVEIDRARAAGAAINQTLQIIDFLGGDIADSHLLEEDGRVVRLGDSRRVAELSQIRAIRSILRDAREICNAAENTWSMSQSDRCPEWLNNMLGEEEKADEGLQNILAERNQ